MCAQQEMKYTRQKNEMPVAGNETYFIQIAWVSYFITHLGVGVEVSSSVVVLTNCQSSPLR